MAERSALSLEDCSFDPASAFQRHGSGGFSILTSEQFPNDVDEKELVKAVKAELKGRGQSEKRRLDRAEKSQLLEQVTAAMGETDTFAARLGEIVRARPGGLPSVEIEYRNVSVEVDAFVGTAGNPTVLNSAKAMAGRLLPRRGGLATKPLAILDDISGVIKPGRFTLVLGPPGAGKSVFMQLLSGRLRRHKGLRVSGSIRYNGEETKNFVVQRTAGLIDQYDHHIPNLTVLETVKFAFDCQISSEVAAAMLVALDKTALARERSRGDADLLAAQQEEGRAGVEVARGTGGSLGDEEGQQNNTEEATTAFPTHPSNNNTQATKSSDQSLLDDDDDDSEFFKLLRKGIVNRLKPYMVLRMLGLQDVADTFVGGEALRGVSGGQRKRVTSAEVMAGPQWALFADEISTGLDSATTHSVIKSLGEFCRHMKRTMVVSLLQPPPEVMALFDDLILMVDGKIIYQ
jgi:ABC-type multidrug transport system ATPase subunit